MSTALQPPEGRISDFDAGVFLVDKPIGPTSFKIVQLVRRNLGIKKVGHAGTLDPFATGLLVICAGRPATRIISRLMDGEKEYEATLKLGVETDTFDLEGKITASRPVGELDRARVEKCVSGFEGEQLQVPPSFSALKHKGKPLYYYARKGIEIACKPRRIQIREINCIDISADTLSILVRCGKGTYIRSLASDIGTALGCGAHLIALRRLRSGLFSVTNALAVNDLLDREKGRDLLLEHMLSVEEVLEMLPRCN